MPGAMMLQAEPFNIQRLVVVRMMPLNIYSLAAIHGAGGGRNQKADLHGLLVQRIAFAAQYFIFGSELRFADGSVLQHVRVLNHDVGILVGAQFFVERFHVTARSLIGDSEAFCDGSLRLSFGEKLVNPIFAGGKAYRHSTNLAYYPYLCNQKAQNSLSNTPKRVLALGARKAHYGIVSQPSQAESDSAQGKLRCGPLTKGDKMKREVVDSKHSAAFMRMMIRIDQIGREMMISDLNARDARDECYRIMGRLQYAFYQSSCMGDLL